MGCTSQKLSWSLEPVGGGHHVLRNHCLGYRRHLGFSEWPVSWRGSLRIPWQYIAGHRECQKRRISSCGTSARCPTGRRCLEVIRLCLGKWMSELITEGNEWSCGCPTGCRYWKMLEMIQKVKQHCRAGGDTKQAKCGKRELKLTDTAN